MTDVRVSKVAVDVLVKPTPDVRVSKVAVDVLIGPELPAPTGWSGWGLRL